MNDLLFGWFLVGIGLGMFAGWSLAFTRVREEIRRRNARLERHLRNYRGEV